MKQIITGTFFIIFFISCQEKVSQNDNSQITKTEEVEKITKAKINFDSHPIAKRYKTVISEKYYNHEVNFANHYIIVTWGCGSGCVTGAMVDTRDGHVYTMPEDKEWSGNGNFIDSKKDSNLLLTVVVSQSLTGEKEELRKYWEWKEDLKIFKFKKVESIILNKE